MNHDTTRSAIELGPVGQRGGSYEDDEPGGTCSLCLGAGWLEPPTGPDMDCPVCDGTGITP